MYIIKNLFLLTMTSLMFVMALLNLDDLLSKGLYGEMAGIHAGLFLCCGYLSIQSFWKLLAPDHMLHWLRK